VIQVGQVLDKYELLERVGQGGMSVVYRATDRSLRRTVAVKILHRHLADSAEARDRFEREAHAVAKLRHENIVEIFAYSGKGSEDSYIVTEFIDGSTLKEFLNDHPIAFPEVAGMIVLQVCRALAHAHGAGVLHRDIKPENVMIRSDGVVKLMDFGISQMVDLQRLTVTGQLLGSPAYMSPEHVEGQPLDFRTDVFACGIVLYQLATGRLPFEGKNPHEILKRIADCKFNDPRQVNPRVGNELGRIILKAMAREPRDRYRDVSAMLNALDAYCTGSGLGPAAQELARYFQSPASYEMALKSRLVDHLVRKGKETMPISRQQALESFDRVLTVDPTNSTVLAVLERLSDRRRWKRGAVIGLILLIVAGGAYGARKMMLRGEPVQTAGNPIVHDGSSAPIRITQPDVIPDPAVPPDGAPAKGGDADHPPDHSGNGNGNGGTRPIRTTTPDAAPLEPPPAQIVTVKVTPKGSILSIDGVAQPLHPDNKYDVAFTGDAVKVLVVNEDCCEAKQRTLSTDDVGKVIAVNLSYLPGTVITKCDKPGVTVRIGSRAAELDREVSITFGDTTSTRRKLQVEFIGAETIDKQTVVVEPNQTTVVTCAL
jgi:serine/threonine protein kinase